MKQITLSLLTIFTLAFNTKAQDLETILLAGKEDGEKLMTAYTQPVLKGLVYSMNNGWYHTAKVHKKFGFDITIAANASFVPSKEKMFNITELGLNSIKPTNGVTTSPTIAAEENITSPTLTFTGQVDGQNVSTDIEMPQGESINIIPAPAVQVGIGLPYKLEAMLRFVPKVGSDNVKGSLFGIGLKKEITDWFGPMDKTPLHISLLAAYTNMNVDYAIGTVTGDVTTNNGAAEFKLNSYTVQAIASLNLPVINFYGGIGYNGGNSTLNMLGDYTLSYDTGGSINLSNPLSLKSTTGSVNATIGARLSLGFFKLFGSYTLQDYGNVNAGIAFSFR